MIEQVAYMSRVKEMPADNKADVIEFWRGVELFAPQRLSKPSEGSHAWHPEEPHLLPWQPGHELGGLPIRGTQTWQHTVLCGVYSIDEVFDRIRKLNPAGERMSGERPPAGQSALAAFVVAGDGRPILGSIVLASSAWAVSQALRDGLGSVANSSFARTAAAFRLEWDELFADEDGDQQTKRLQAEGHRVGAPIDWTDLLASEELVRRVLQLDELDRSDPLRNARELMIISRKVSARYPYSVAEREFLNSFYAEDLRRVAHVVKSGTYGKALHEYLTPARAVDAVARIDVEHDISYVRRASSARRIPSGRWPSSAAHTASLGQQLALNTFLSERKQRLFSVNGPPGTGKTAMLRDLLAAIVTERAIELAKLTRPEDAFEQTSLAWGANARGRVHQLRPELTGFELVLACTTNTAAENVSAEIPAAEAIDDRWKIRTDYFADISTSMLNGTRAGQGDRQAWAMVAAVLGSRRRNNTFLKHFWFEGLRPKLTEHPPTGTWKQAVNAFREAHNRVEELREQRANSSDLLEELQRAIEEQEQSRARLERIRSELVATDRRLSQLRRTVRLTRQSRSHEAHLHAGEESIRELRRQIATARAQHAQGTDAMVFPDERWAHPDVRDWRERHAPWLDDAFDIARSDLFLAALDLHQAFLYGARRQMRASLTCATELISGRASSSVSEAAAKAAWQCLFMAVPLVSTTFASFPYLFRSLGAQAIGWLLVDEAGQATPQAAVGPLWRSMRAVVVGDPLQLEPISTLPVSIKNALRLEHGVDTSWLPNGSSVQTLADQVARVGTYRGDGTNAVWVGTPLNAHRRCESPMFEIVNSIAYDNQMINCTPPRPYLALPESHWIDVPSAPSTGNWVNSEGEALQELLEGLRLQAVDFSEVFVITPFRDVASRIARHRKAFPGIHAGTVHTAQGREADIVVLILGGSSDYPGARAWAAVKPNLLNVAVSRARRRLYVIGDRAAWSALPHFRTLADAIETLPSSLAA